MGDVVTSDMAREAYGTYGSIFIVHGAHTSSGHNCHDSNWLAHRYRTFDFFYYPYFILKYVNFIN